MKSFYFSIKTFSFIGFLLSLFNLSERIIHNTIKIVDFSLLSVLALLFLILYFKERKNQKIVNEILKNVERILEGNLNSRVFVTGNKDFSRLAQLINEMAKTFQKVEIDYRHSEESRRILLSNISHDLRTPLTSIIGYLEALRDDIADSREEQEEYTDIIYSKALRLKHQVENIFYMAKLDSDEVPMDFEVLNLCEVVHESVTEFLPEIQKENIYLETDIIEENARVYGDRLGLLRIINNLIGNSLIHGKEGGVLGVELVSLSGEYRLCVWDKGPGISKEHIDNIFNRLYRADHVRKNNSGSGLGLAIAKKLLEKHKGRIWAESEPDERTSFYFTLPKL